MNTHPNCNVRCFLAGDSTGMARLTDYDGGQRLLGDGMVNENRFLCGDKQPGKAADDNP